MQGGMGHNFDAVAGNWIALSRDMATHWLVGFGQPVAGANKNRGAHSRSEAWIDLIMLARWKPGTETNKGRKIDLGVGQLQGGYSFLALRWNWTLKQVRSFLEKLVTEQMIEKGQPDHSTTVPEVTSKQGKQPGNQVQIVTLCNYSKYQLSWDLEGLLKGQAEGKRGASEGQHLNKETRKQVKEEEDKPPQSVRDAVAVVDEVPGLNGATSIIVGKLAGWINPMMPDSRTARASVENFVGLYGSDVVRDAFAKLEAKYLHGDIVARPIPYLAGECGRLAKTKAVDSGKRSYDKFYEGVL